MAITKGTGSIIGLSIAQMVVGIYLFADALSDLNN